LPSCVALVEPDRSVVGSRGGSYSHV
jgi:hypothetical protein